MTDAAFGLWLFRAWFAGVGMVLLVMWLRERR